MTLHGSFASMRLRTPSVRWFKMAAQNVMVQEHEPKQEERSLFSSVFSDPVHNFL